MNNMINHEYDYLKFRYSILLKKADLKVKKDVNTGRVSDSQLPMGQVKDFN